MYKNKLAIKNFIKKLNNNWTIKNRPQDEITQSLNQRDFLEYQDEGLLELQKKKRFLMTII